MERPRPREGHYRTLRSTSRSDEIWKILEALAESD
jgi:hypothetical protein